MAAHSKASKVAIQLFQNQGQIILIVEDNGRGMANGNSDGHGLLNIQSSLNTINGKVNYEPGSTAGTAVTISIPAE